MKLLATEKPRVQGYIPSWLHEFFEDYRVYRGLSQSEAIEQALVAFFCLSPEEMKSLEEWAHKENRSPGRQALTILQKAIRDHDES